MGRVDCTSIVDNGASRHDWRSMTCWLAMTLWVVGCISLRPTAARSQAVLVFIPFRLSDCQRTLCSSFIALKLANHRRVLLLILVFLLLADRFICCIIYCKSLFVALSSLCDLLVTSRTSKSSAGARWAIQVVQVLKGVLSGRAKAPT